MYRSALVGLKLDAPNGPLIEAALDLAERQKLMLMAVAVVDPDVIAPREPVPPMADAYRVRRNDALTTQAHARAQIQLEDFARRCAERGITCSTEAREGSTGEELSIAVRASDLLMVGHGGGTESCSTAREDISVLDSVLKVTVQPALVIPCSSPQPETVVLAYDGSAQSGRALHEFGISGLWQDARVEVVSIGAEVAEATELAQRAADYLSLHGYTAEAKPIVAKYDIANHLVDYVHTSGAGAIIMGAYGKSRWRDFFFGTVTKGVLRAAMVPIFLAH